MTLALVGVALALATALAGFAVIAFWFARVRTPRTLIFAHPILGAVTVAYLWTIIARWPGSHDLPYDAGAVVLSLVFAAGGLLFSLRISRLPRPFFVVLVHAIAALFACALLLIGFVHLQGVA